MAGWQDAFTDIDPVVHQPGRLMLLTMLASVESADFLFLLRVSGLTKGNLSAHLAKLEGAGYVAITKSFKGKVPMTVCAITASGRTALEQHKERLRMMATRIARLTSPA